MKEYILASALVFSAPSEPASPRPPAARMENATTPTIGVFAESYVTVAGLEGKLMVRPDILKEFRLESGQEIPQEVMYQILERNNKLR